MSTSNPAVRDYNGPDVWSTTSTFTVAGAALKSLILLTILSASFAYTWDLATHGYAESFAPTQQADGTSKIPDAITIPSNVYGLALTGSLAGFVVAMVIIFNQRTAPFLAPIYAGLEGLALGAISAGAEAQYPGITLQAVGSTLGVTYGMLGLYGLGILKPTQGFAAGLIAAMFGILALYIVDDVMMLFGSYVPVVHSSGPWGIVLQVFIVGIAALNLILDFGQITEAAERRAPKWFEWYAGFSLLVTLVWLYLEIIRLIMKTRSSDD